MTVWLNGALMGSGVPVIEPSDRGFLLADGLFETFLVAQGEPVFFEAHMDRLEKSAAELKLPLPFSRKKILKGMRALLAANDLAKEDRASLRLTLSRGPGARGIALPEEPRPTLLITCAPLGPAPAGVTAITASVRRNETSPASRMKTLAYLDNVLARQEANEKNAAEAIMLNTKGRLACGTIGNLFVWQGAALFTPDLSEGVLPGITRGKLLEIASQMGMTCHEAPLETQALQNSDGAFLTNSLVGIQRIRKIDGTALPDHPLTAELEGALRAALEKSKPAEAE
ncbi:aminotransferase class IV [Tepidicaulis sp. LMO-SS28]|uniref:aminotransferase class IV n=1 Tax=Tepidicaulis sp. LMO-SS28 TaxID=3447455 RepID=UPI003EE1BDDA